MIVCDELNLSEVLAIANNINPPIKDIIVIGSEKKKASAIIPIRCTILSYMLEPKYSIPLCKIHLTLFNNLFFSDLLADDGKTAPQKVALNWEKDVIYLPFTSTSGGSRGIMHTHRSLVASFYSPDNAANHWFDQVIGESVACGNWFFHMTGFYAFALSSIYGLTMYTLSEYTNESFLEMIVDNKIGTATVYPWQVSKF